MRMPPTRRGAHPKQRSSSLRAWFLDEVTGDYSPSVWGPVSASIGSVPNLGPTTRLTTAMPYIGDSPVGMSRSFVKALSMGMEGPGNDTDSINAFTDAGREGTIAAWIKCTNNDNYSTVVALVGNDNADTLDSNYLISIRIQDAADGGGVDVATEHGVAGDNGVFSSSYEVPLNRWLYICVVKSPDGADPAVKYDLYVNGRYIEEMSLRSGTAVNASGGNDAVWSIGGVYDSSPLQWANRFSGDIGGVYAWSESLTAAQIEEDYRRGLLLPFHTSQNVRVAVEKPDAAGTALYYDATDLDGLDFVSSLSTSNSPDNACVAGTLKFLREQENLSLAYLKNDTRLNLLDPTDTAGTIERFIDIKRGIKIYAATTPLGIQASGRDYWQFLDGTIDGVDWGTEETSVMFRDKGGVLVDTFIESEDKYGNGDLVNIVMRDILFDNSNDNPARVGSYDDPGEPKSEIAAPFSWAVEEYTQKREPVMVALRTMAGQFGHDVKYRWYEETESFELVLYEPERDSITLSALFAPDDIKSISKAEIVGQRIRNVVRVSYDSAETQAEQTTNLGITLPPEVEIAGGGIPAGEGVGYKVNGETNVGPDETEETPAFVELEYDASITSYGRRFMEVQESSTSQINLGSEAIKMALSMILDLANPEFDHAVTVPLTPFLNIHDIVGFQPNSYLYTESQHLAIASITHNFQEDATSTITLRGKPNLGFRRWLALESRGAPNPANSPMEASNSLTKSQKLQSLQSVLSKSQMNMGGRYMQVRNNAFTTWADGRLNPPTSWNTLLGSFDGTSMGFSETSKTGALSVVFSAASNSVQSDLIPLDGYDDNPYALECSWQIDESTPGVSTDVVQVSLDFYDADGVFIPASTQVFTPGSGFPSVTGKKQQWYTSRSMGVSPPAGDLARYFRITTEKDAGTDKVVVDNVSLYKIAPEMKALLSTSLVWENTPDNSLDYTVIGNTYNVCWGNVSSPDGYDYGSNIDIDEGGAAPPPNYTGHSFVVPVDGNYEISSQCFLRIHNTNNAGGTSAGTFTIGMQIRTGVEYGSTGEVLVVGSTVASSGWLNADIPALGPLGTWFPLDFISVSPTPVYLSAGDKVSCVLLPGGNFAAGTPGFETGPFAGGLGGEISFFRVKLLDQT